MLGRKRNPDTTRAMKALSLYSLLLFSGRRYSLPELEKLLECSKPTVQRIIQDIESTRGLHAPIMTEKIGGLMFPMAARHIPDFNPVFEQFANDLKKEAETIQKAKN